MTNFAPLTKNVHDALVALGTAAAIVTETHTDARSMPLLRGDLRDRYKLSARCMLLGYKIDFETLFLTPKSAREARHLTRMLDALPRSPEGSESKQRLSEAYADLLGENWFNPDGSGRWNVDEATKNKLAEQVCNLDWCNEIWSQLFETRAKKADIVDCFVTVFMTGMRARCPVQEFPSQWCVFGNTRTLDELEVIHLSASIRKKPEWRMKLQDENIVSKWREEAYAQNVTPSMFDYMVAELGWFAEQIEPETGIDYATVPGVFFSDSLIPDADRDALRSGVELLSAVPETEKDWHPRSNGQVLDLVHPSLYPYVLGRTPLLQELHDYQAFPVGTNPDNTADDINMVATSILRSLRPISHHRLISSPTSSLLLIGHGAPTSNHMPGLTIVQRRWSEYSGYQWLPVDVKLSPGPKHSAKFLSYINNLYPGGSPGVQLYPVLEAIFGRFIPLFERTLTETRLRRTGDEGVRAEFLNGSIRNSEKYWDILPPRSKALDGYISPEQWEEYYQDREFLRPIVAPFIAPRKPRSAQVILGGRTVQVILKMANIHLTPEKPAYNGGSWHVEGTESEGIVATGIYYYESVNIKEPCLEFRQAIQEPVHERHDFDHLKHLYGIESSGESLTNQPLGAVGIPEGRCICFPNGVQHRLSPFRLIDDTKPGHRKILVFFLVDPSERILSTSDVPPQQLEWFFREIQIQSGTRLSMLPMELFDMICNHIRAEAVPIDEEEPLSGLMTLSEALDHRLTLMDERADFLVAVNKSHYESSFSLCEH